MWKLYDAMINGIPEGIEVTSVFSGSSFSCVCTAENMGICETLVGGQGQSRYVFSGSESLRQLAGLVKSWNYVEASIGLAAINCWYNSQERLNADGWILQKSPRALPRTVRLIADNKNVALFQHCAYAEEILRPISELSVVTETVTQMGDYTDAAIFYILRQQDAVFAGSQALLRKKLDVLSQNTEHLVLFGPGVPMCGTLLSHKADELLGYCVPMENQNICRTLILSGAPREEIVKHLYFVRMERRCR